MVTLKIHATGSTGNCYQLCAGEESILLDAGIQYRKLVRATSALRGVQAALITHEHKDHCAAVNALRGLRTAMSAGTAQAIGVTPTYTVQDKQRFSIGPFDVIAFRTEHDAADPLGFLIRVEGVTIVYATDTYFLHYRFPGVNWWLLECNYCDDALYQMTNIALRKRLERSHMSLSRVKQLFQANDLTNTKGIILCHMSSERSDEARMIQEVTDISGIHAIAADGGMEIELCR